MAILIRTIPSLGVAQALPSTNPTLNQTKQSDTITLPVGLLKLLDLDRLFEEELIRELGLDDSFDSAAAETDELAKRRQLARVAGDKKTIDLTLSSTITIPGLKEEEIEECVAFFLGKLSPAIVGDSRLFLELWKKKCLQREFSSRIEATLTWREAAPSPTGVPIPKSTLEARHPIPVHLQGYEIRMIISNPERGRSEKVLTASSLTPGSRYDFFKIIPKNNK